MKPGGSQLAGKAPKQDEGAGDYVAQVIAKLDGMVARGEARRLGTDSYQIWRDPKTCACVSVFVQGDDCSTVDSYNCPLHHAGRVQP